MFVLSDNSAIFIKNWGFGNTLTPQNSTAIEIKEDENEPLGDFDGPGAVAPRLAEGGLRVVGVVAGLARHRLHLLQGKIYYYLKGKTDG